MHDDTSPVTQKDNSDVLAHVPRCTYPIARYHPWKHGLNVHSWLTLEDVAWNTRDPQKSSALLQYIKLNVLQSRDLLDTTELKIDYTHNFQGKLGQAAAAFVYKGWYPVISLKGILEGRYQKEKIAYDRMLDLKLETPWTLQHGQYTYKPLLYTKGTLHRNTHTTWYTQAYVGSFERISQASPRDIYAPWKQKLTIRCIHTPLWRGSENI